MTRREKVLSVTAFLMIWFGVGYRFWYQPLAQQIQAVELQIAAAESEGWPADIKPWSNADQLAEPAGKSRFLDYEVQREREKQIPKQQAITQLLEQLVVWADETGVRLTGFKVEPENTGNVQNAGRVQKAANADDADNVDNADNADNVDNVDNKEAGFRVIQVHTEMEGPYVQVIAFLVKLEQAERLIRVEQLEFSLNDRAGSSQSASSASSISSVSNASSASPGSGFFSLEGIYNPNLQARIIFSIYYRPD